MGHKINGGVNYGPRCLTTGAGDRCCCEGYEGLIAEQGKCEPPLAPSRRADGT
jgi:hypothetical protein